jgi:maltooligosyltrehalose trehalohydrolase
LPALAHLDNASLTATVIAPTVLEIRRWCDESRVVAWLNFAAKPMTVTVEPGAGPWNKQLDAADPAWGGEDSTLPPQLTDGAIPAAINLPPYGVAVYTSAVPS